MVRKESLLMILFAPHLVSNTPLPAFRDLHALHRRYLHEAGAVFEDDNGAEVGG